MPRYFVGIDAGRHKHFVTVVDSQGNVLFEQEIANTSSSFDWLINTLTTKFGNDLCFALELKNGVSNPWDHFIVAKGFSLTQIPPNAVKSFKDNVLSIRNKTDHLDSLAIALLLKDAHSRFRKIDQPRIVLKTLTRHLDMLTRDKTRLMNRLHRAIAGYFPEFILDMPFSQLDLQAPLHLLSVCPDPREMVKLGYEGLRRLINEGSPRAQHSSISKALEVAGTCTNLPPDADCLMLEIKNFAIQLLLVIKQIKELEQKILQISAKDEDVHRIGNIKGVGLIAAAKFMGLIQDVSFFANNDHLASYAGLGGLKHQSGASKGFMKKNFAVSKKLKSLMFNITWNRAMNDSNSMAYYKKKKQKYSSHGKALRALGRHIIRMFFKILKTKTAFDETILLKNKHCETKNIIKIPA